MGDFRVPPFYSPPRRRSRDSLIGRSRSRYLETTPPSSHRSSNKSVFILELVVEEIIPALREYNEPCIVFR